MVGNLVVAREGGVDRWTAAHHVGEHAEHDQVADDDAQSGAEKRVAPSASAARENVAAPLAYGRRQFEQHEHHRERQAQGRHEWRQDRVQHTDERGSLDRANEAPDVKAGQDRRDHPHRHRGLEQREHQPDGVQPRCTRTPCDSLTVAGARRRGRRGFTHSSTTVSTPRFSRSPSTPWPFSRS